MVAERREYRALLAITLALYVAVYGWLMLQADGLPYVMDNNESFSVMWHAQNMAEHDFSRSFWLTDEAYGPNPAAHPFVHSHQGNFPRLYGYVLYVLGARTIEAQIIVTTFTIGTLSCFLLFRFFSVTAGPRFAAVASLVFMTDYLFYAQWQVVTYRVWHGFFLFASLLCAHHVARSESWRRWLIATALVYLGLFYYELIFVAFVALFTAFYVVALGWRTPSRVVMFGLVQAGGGATALAILLIQLAFYLGWDGLRDDIFLTYVARNFATATPDLSRYSPWSVHDVQAMIGGITAIDPGFRARLEQFYDRHNLVFWWNLADSRSLRQVRFFVASAFIWVFQIYTPLFTLVVGTVLAGWTLSADRFWRWRSRPVGADTARWSQQEAAARSWFQLRGGLAIERRRRLSQAPAETAARAASADGRRLLLSWLALLTIAAGVLALVMAVSVDDAFQGLPLAGGALLGRIGGFGLVALVAGCLLGAATLARWLAGGWAWPRSVSGGRLFLAGGLLIGLALYVRMQPGLYDQEYAPIWHGLITGQTPAWSGRAAVLLAALLAAAMVACGRRALVGAEQAAALERVAPYLWCGAAAYALVYWLATGYVLTGYLTRFAPLTVFLTDVLIALAISIALAVALRGVAPLVARGAAGSGAATDAPRPGMLRPDVQRLRLLAAAGASALLLIVAGYWAHTQVAYIAAFPPERFTFLRIFAEPPYRGASFAVSTYAAPLAYFTQQWAYFDPVISNGQVQVKDGQVQLDRDARTYLWLADRHSNPAYQYPDYYACITTSSFRGLLQREIGEEPRTGRCSIIAMVQRAQSLNQELMRFELVAQDESPSDAWAIVRLNWQPLPYLEPLSERRSDTVQLTLERDGPDRTVAVTYRYADPLANPERGTVIRLYEEQERGSPRLLHESTGTRRLEVPAGFRGKLVVSVAPGDGTRVGAEYLSQPLEVLP